MARNTKRKPRKWVNKTDKANINLKNGSNKSTPSWHLGSLGGSVLRKTREGKEFQVKINDFGTTLGTDFLLPLLVFFGRHFFWWA